MKKKLIKCPYCGSAGGVCNEFKVSGIDYYKFDGSIDGKEITGPYEHTKYVECIDCGKRIMTYEEFVEYYIQEYFRNQKSAEKILCFFDF